MVHAGGRTRGTCGVERSSRRRAAHRGTTRRHAKCCCTKSPRACGYLDEVGLGYLSLDRPTRTLSGGEVERVNLTTCLGASLVNTLFVLDEPSIGLHPRDTGRLIRVMQQLRDKGNTLLVVEHDEAVMRAADNLVEIGPGRGEGGGELVFSGESASPTRQLRRLRNSAARAGPESRCASP